MTSRREKTNLIATFEGGFIGPGLECPLVATLKISFQYIFFLKRFHFCLISIFSMLNIKATNQFILTMTNKGKNGLWTVMVYMVYSREIQSWETFQQCAPQSGSPWDISLNSSPFSPCALHSSCQNAAETLISSSLVRYANLQTCLFLWLSCPLLHFPTVCTPNTGWPACHLSFLSKRERWGKFCCCCSVLDEYKSDRGSTPIDHWTRRGLFSQQM